MLASGYTAIEGEIRSLQSTIDACQEQIRACRTRQNEFNPTAKLPDELLIEIFLYLVKEEAQFMTLSWIRVTHVSSRWRRVAINCPKLWSWPSFRRAQHIDTLLERARSAPLNVILYLNGRCSEKGVKTAVQNLHRIQHLTAYEVDPSICAHYLKSYSQASGPVKLPLLRSLTLSTTYLRARHLNLGGKLIHAPRLNHLKLRNWGLPHAVVASDTPIPLTTLEITISRDEGQAVQQNTLREVLNHLDVFGGLRCLSLSNVFLSADEQNANPKTPPPPTILPNLTQVTIHATARATRRFFESIIYPSDKASVSVQCLRGPGGSTGHETPEVRQLFSVLLGHLKEGIRALHFLPAEDRRGFYAMNMWTSPCDQDLEYTEHPATISICLPFDRNIFDDIGQWTQLQDLEHLVYHAPLSKISFWRDFGTLKRLWLVDVGKTHPAFLGTLFGAPSLKKTMSKDKIAPSAGPALDIFSESGSQYFPALRDLSFNEWAFDGLSKDTVDFDRFVRVLKQRQDECRGVENLHIWGCTGIDCSNVEGFMKAVTHVYWDPDGC